MSHPFNARITTLDSMALVCPTRQPKSATQPEAPGAMLFRCLTWVHIKSKSTRYLLGCKLIGNTGNRTVWGTDIYLVVFTRPIMWDVVKVIWHSLGCCNSCYPNPKALNRVQAWETGKIYLWLQCEWQLLLGKGPTITNVNNDPRQTHTGRGIYPTL